MHQKLRFNRFVGAWRFVHAKFKRCFYPNEFVHDINGCQNYMEKKTEIIIITNVISDILLLLLFIFFRYV